MATHTNRLIHEKSPYLLQHAHNPVDWRPWSAEAFEVARREDKPIFLSVGYSSCHWCHVMERESFQNEEIAELLNRYFVPVKVDREERPDVDRLYMAFVQATTGSGGWPMSVFLTPEGKPFFGGTYFPPDNRHGRPGFRHLLEQIARTWHLDRERVRVVAATAVERLQRYAMREAGVLPGLQEAADSAFNIYRRLFDRVHGGFGDAPKFPRPAVLQFLLRYWDRTGRQEALDMALATLDAMARGGIRDHLGGGFHRYSVDEAWRVPHFEKMLYDQAQLAVCYLEAFQITNRPAYAAVARETLDYVLRDMRDPEGGFYSAEDADSAPDPERPDQTEEGAFYLWTADEVRAALGRPVADWFCLRYGVEAAGAWVLWEAADLSEAATAGVGEAEIAVALAEARRKMLAARERRPRPARDEKILAGWNGLMLSALARAFRVLGESRYLEAAEACARFLTARMYDGRTLWRRFWRGEAGIPAFLEDYAFVIQGLLDLYETGFEPRPLALAVELSRQQCELFEDPDGGAFFSAWEDPMIPIRLKDDYDGAEPSANSVAVWNCLRLAALTGEEQWRQKAERTLSAFGRQLATLPDSLPLMLAAAMYLPGGLRQVVVRGALHSAEFRALVRVVHQGFYPDVVLLEPHSAGAGWARDLPPAQARAEAHVCENFSCRAPVNEAGELALQLARRSGA
jgi:uncharacterized protein YyaL (SSP411 family)